MDGVLPQHDHVDDEVGRAIRQKLTQHCLSTRRIYPMCLMREVARELPFGAPQLGVDGWNPWCKVMSRCVRWRPVVRVHGQPRGYDMGSVPFANHSLLGRLQAILQTFVPLGSVELRLLLPPMCSSRFRSAVSRATPFRFASRITTKVIPHFTVKT